MEVTDSTAVMLVRSRVGKIPYTDSELERVITHVGDADLAATAILLQPRPAWVHVVATDGADL